MSKPIAPVCYIQAGKAREEILASCTVLLALCLLCCVQPQEMSLAGQAGNKYSSAPDASTYQEALDQLQNINTSSLFSSSYAPLTEPLRPYSTQEAFMPELPLPRHAFEQQRPVPHDLPSMVCLSLPFVLAP